MGQGNIYRLIYILILEKNKINFSPCPWVLVRGQNMKLIKTIEIQKRK